MTNSFPENNQQDLVRPSITLLDRLEGIIRKAHRGVLIGDGHALKRAFQAGEALLQIKKDRLLRRGQWAELYERLGISRQDASEYTLLAKHRSIIEGRNVGSSRHLSFAAALRLARKPKGSARASAPKPSSNISEEALQAWALSADLQDAKRFLAWLRPDIRDALRADIIDQGIRLKQQALNRRENGATRAT